MRQLLQTIKDIIDKNHAVARQILRVVDNGISGSGFQCFGRILISIEMLSFKGKE